MFGAALSVLIPCAAAALPPSPYRDLSAAGTAFSDSVAPHVVLDTLSAVRLGVLSPFNDPDGAAILEGVRLAVLEANAEGGCHGLPFAIVPRTTEGPWGVTANQAAALAYDDNVWAIIGGLNGHQAHLAELISAKAWIPVITPWASDRTIDYANVPWVFRIAPDDGVQARSLWEYALRRGLNRLVVATEGTRDGRVAQMRLLDAARETHHPAALVLEYNPVAPEDLLPRIVRSHADALVLWGRHETAVEMLLALRRSGYRGLILAPALLAVPELLAHADSLGEIVVAAPYDLSRTSPESASFAQTYEAANGHAPRPSAVMAYDAARMVIASVRSAGLNRAAIRRALAQGKFAGLGGRWAFNSLGGAERESVLLTVRDGRWSPAEPRTPPRIGEHLSR